MGRWGHLLYESDQDLNISEHIEDHIRNSIGGEWTLSADESISGSAILLVTDPDGGRRVATRNTRKAQAKLIPSYLLQEYVDDGHADELFEKYNTFHDRGNEYANVILGALMMQMGCKLEKKHRDYLREVADKIPGRYGHYLPLEDSDWREPGKTQFLTALDNYKDGEHRKLGPSCWNCGKTKAETGRTPSQCNRCRMACYCRKECQKAEWAKHKPICSPPTQGRNV